MKDGGTIGTDSGAVTGSGGSVCKDETTESESELSIIISASVVFVVEDQNLEYGSLGVLRAAA